MGSVVNVSGRNLPPPQVPFVNPPDPKNSGVDYALSDTGYQFLLNLLNHATSSLAAGVVDKSLSATGNNQATALQLNADWNEFDHVPAGSGALLSALQPGQIQLVFNDDPAQALLVYPPPGGTINRLNENDAFSVPFNAKTTFYFTTATEIKT
jgi:hypothetical protein